MLRKYQQSCAVQNSTFLMVFLSLSLEYTMRMAAMGVLSPVSQI